jgi:hypothetical protein
MKIVERNLVFPSNNVYSWLGFLSSSDYKREDREDER